MARQKKGFMISHGLSQLCLKIANTQKLFSQGFTTAMYQWVQLFFHFNSYQTMGTSEFKALLFLATRRSSRNTLDQFYP